MLPWSRLGECTSCPSTRPHADLLVSTRRSTANDKGKGRATEFDDDDAFNDELDMLDGEDGNDEPRQAAAPAAAGPSQSQRHHQPNGTANGHAQEDDEDPAPVGPTPSIVPGEEREEDCIKARLLLLSTYLSSG